MYFVFLYQPRSIRVQSRKNVESWKFKEGYLNAHLTPSYKVPKNVRRWNFLSTMGGWVLQYPKLLQLLKYLSSRSRLSDVVGGIVHLVSGQSVDKPKRWQLKRWQTETSTNQNVDRPKRRQTKMSTDQNVDSPKRWQPKTSTKQNVDRRRQAKDSTDQNIDRPKRRQTEMSTNQNVEKPKYWYTKMSTTQNINKLKRRLTKTLRNQILTD